LETFVKVVVLPLLKRKELHMPRNSGHVPAYRLHKLSCQARVILDGRHIYLGPYGSDESREKYAKLITQPNDSTNESEKPAELHNGLSDLSVNELILSYWQYAKVYYSKEGKHTKEFGRMREALQPLKQLFGHSPVNRFGPKALKTVRQFMIDKGLSRGVVNRRVGRIKRMFKWAVVEELVPSSTFHGLQAVTGLCYGRTDARETEPIKPVPKEWVDAILPYVSPQVAAMVQIQWLTGMRPCELVAMRPCDIDMTSEIWVYEPYEHKNRWRSHSRKIPLGPKAQEILKPFLDRLPTACLFSPQEAEAWRHARQRKQRKTPMTPSQARRKPKAKPKRPRRDHYDTATYEQAIDYGIAAANKHRNGEGQIPHWFPLQIRHSRGTEVRHLYGLDAAQVALGHARADVTQVYAEKNQELATQIAKEMG
jgi:integrase